MTFQFIFLLLAILKVATSQYYGSPPPSPYQIPYNYYSPAPIPYTPLYAPPYPQQFAPPGYAPSAFSSTVASAPKYSQPPYQPPSYPPPRFPEPRLPSTPTLPPFTAPGMHQVSYPTPIYPPTPSPTAAPQYAPMTVAPKCNPPTAVAYYLTSIPDKSKASSKEKVKEKLREKLPTYPCPFCSGFADVPKNSKVPPPPASSSVLPGILDKIPTIKLPEKFKIGDLSKMTPPSPPLFPDSFEKKLAAKLRFDEDLLDGFLTGLGLGKLQLSL